MYKLNAKFRLGICASPENKRLALKHSLLKKLCTSVDNDSISAAYVPREVENNCKSEEVGRYFETATKNKDNVYKIILPPPNITGVLHLGHALTATIQDVILRWRRIQGQETLWVPGIDHAGIATQVVVEKRLWKERKLTRHDLGREKFEQEVWKWKQEKEETIQQQLRRMGTSLEWSRMTFTMDPEQSRAVTEAFIRLHDAGLIYRDNYLVNWSCILQSAISDIEVDHLEITEATRLPVPGYDGLIDFGVLTEFAYRLSDSDAEEIVVATTRPETMLGDVAVAVHPTDDRYARFIGRSVQHPFRNDRIPIIADEFVDRNFGTGAVKITPAHDRNDFEVGKRHSLRNFQVINESGNLTESCGRFSGMKRFDAREAVIRELGNSGLLRGTRSHPMTVPVCSRSKDVVELLVKPQWFVRCKGMAERAIADVKEERLTIDPPVFQSTWFNWLENIRDWCISRQLWWGHRVPAYTCSVTSGSDFRQDSALPTPTDARKCWVAAASPAEARSKAAIILDVPEDSVTATQDEDVLDTWFSSALLPFSAFGWPQQSEDLKRYYPLSLMETGHDIIFFWVARMVMLGTQLTGRLPFDKILLHGIVCDAQGRKMSKSLGNVIAPEDVINGITLKQLEANTRENLKAGILSEEELKKAVDGQRRMFPQGIPACGVDPLRFTLCSHNVKNHFINFDVAECNANRLFCNKIWQATKYTRTALATVSQAQGLHNHSLNLDENTVLFSEDTPKMDKWILSRLDSMLQDVDAGFRGNQFHLATAALKNFLYYNFCDVYLESTKRELRSGDSRAASSHALILLRCLDVSLRALAPFMPHLTEHLHRRLPAHPGLPITTGFPQPAGCRDKDLEVDIQIVLGVVSSVRRLKKLFGVTTKHRPEVRVVTEAPILGNLSTVIEDLGGCGRVTVTSGVASTGRVGAPGERVALDTVDTHAIVHLILPAAVTAQSLDANRARLDKKKDKLVAELGKLQRVISAPAYEAGAPPIAKEVNSKKISDLESELEEVTNLRNMLNV